MFVLDTNVISELRRSERANAGVLQWAAAEPVELFFLSAISILELDLGVLQVERRDLTQGAVLRTWLEQQVIPRFEGRVLPVDMAVARQCARLQVPDRRAERDALIAATAMVHGMTVVTRNTADFEATGVKLLNPWRAA